MALEKKQPIRRCPTTPPPVTEVPSLPFFFYGTLMDAGVRRAVLGAKAPKRLEPATLIGWRRFTAGIPT